MAAWPPAANPNRQIWNRVTDRIRELEALIRLLLGRARGTSARLTESVPQAVRRQLLQFLAAKSKQLGRQFILPQ